MKKQWFILPVLFAFAFCTAALAAGDKGKGRGNGQNQSEARQEEMRFRGLDRNHDGTISRNEWRGNDRSFANQDVNGDGVLSRAEVHRGARRPDEQLSGDRERRFAELDHNGDGVITRNEWHGDRQAFDRVDTNRDGVLSREETARWNMRGGSGNSSTITCSSDNGQRVHCNADTRGGVRLIRQLSSSSCRQDSTWGYDARGVWVDRGCRAEFEVMRDMRDLLTVQGRTIGAGASISVRTNEPIDVNNSDGRYSAAS